ncbi:ribosome assembly RNA-binding protein YhbY [bacterium]|nr:ribosome assembly RNA-binding protein YhbY [bacterium]
MLTGKQRSYLKGLSNNLNCTIQIGKDGISKAFLKQLDKMLEDNELIKIHVLKNSMLDTKDTANILVEKLKAEYVQAIGNKVVLYRMNKEEPTITLP